MTTDGSGKLIQKHEPEHAQAKINEVYRYGLGVEDDNEKYTD